MPNENSPEYRTIKQCTPDLELALKNDSELDTLSGELSVPTLITGDQAADIKDPRLGGVAHRAGQLVTLIRDKVALETGNYRSFIQVLMQRKDAHKEILEILHKKYKELGGQLETGYPVTSVGLEPTSTCTPPNTEATSIKEFTASSLGNDSRTQPGEPNSPTEPVEEKSLDQPVKNGLGKEGGAQSGEPRLPKEPVTKELEPLLMDDGSPTTKDMAQTSSSSHQEPDAATAVTQSATISDKIEQFEVQFRRLLRQFVTELKASAVTTSDLLDCLALLPMSLSREYGKSVQSMLPVLEMVDSTNKFMLHLNPLMSFLDYGLLAHLIYEFGSHGLVQSMEEYKSDMQIFMKVTTVAQLVHFLPGQPEAPPNLDQLLDRLGDDPTSYTLEQIDITRRKFSPELHLSEIIFHLIAHADGSN